MRVTIKMEGKVLFADVIGVLALILAILSLWF